MTLDRCSGAHDVAADVERLTLERDAARTALVTLAWLLSGQTPPPWPLVEVCPPPDWWDEATG